MKNNNEQLISAEYYSWSEKPIAKQDVSQLGKYPFPALFHQESDELVEQLVPQLFKMPWGHNFKIIFKCSNVKEALFYVSRTIENGWNRLIEYALRNVNSPIGVSEYELTTSLPEDLQSSLPSIEEIEAELGGRDEGEVLS